jgi:ribose 5-phosphate isomerase B
MKILIGCDHAGYQLKEKIKEYLTTHYNYTIYDVGCFDENKCDYPIIVDKVCTKLILHDIGILICNTGIGMSIRANRYNSIRCALCHNIVTAELGRKHNNANVLALGSKIIDTDTAIKIVSVFLNTKFEGEKIRFE